jgi:hypothetical protein
MGLPQCPYPLSDHFHRHLPILFRCLDPRGTIVFISPLLSFSSHISLIELVKDPGKMFIRECSGFTSQHVCKTCRIAALYHGIQELAGEEAGSISLRVGDNLVIEVSFRPESAHHTTSRAGTYCESIFGAKVTRAWTWKCKEDVAKEMGRRAVTKSPRLTSCVAPAEDWHQLIGSRKQTLWPGGNAISSDHKSNAKDLPLNSLVGFSLLLSAYLSVNPRTSLETGRNLLASNTLSAILCTSSQVLESPNLLDQPL